MTETNHQNRKIFTLLDITRSLQSVIRKKYTGNYWVKAEIAKLNFYPKSGHCYPDLVYKEKGKVQAEMRGLIWAKDFKRLSKQFRDVVKEDLKDGMQILFRTTVNFHPKYGLSLNINDIEPSFTLGEMAREKAETIDRLKKDGSYYLNKQIPFPLLPKRIAIISVQTSKGYSDFLNVIDNNRQGYYFHHYLFPALLQGDRAATSISRQLYQINKLKDHFDIVTIIRGGGGDVGLNSYDDYSLARQVARFPLPVLTGIGHSTNETVVEMVAHANKITPTDLAYFLLDRFDVLARKTANLAERLTQKTQAILKSERERLTAYRTFLRSHTLYFVRNERASIDDSQRMLAKALEKRMAGQWQHLQNILQRIHQNGIQHVRQEQSELAQMVRMTDVLTRQKIAEEKSRLEAMEAKQRLLDPRNIMKRGYSMTTVNGKSLTDSRDVSVGDSIKTFLYEGSLESEIKSVNYGEQE